MNKKIIILIINILVFIVIIFSTINLKKEDIYNNYCTYDFVKKVYDGDTVLTKELGKIRILGIDTPEIYHEGWTKIKDYKFYACGEYGENLAKKYLLNKKVKICFDKNEDKTGGYGRYLAYIYFTGENNNLEDFGKILVEKGYAKVYKAANFKNKKLYLQLEKQAKKNKLGIWSKECIEKDKKFKLLHKQ